jgi:hypothetical protein
VTEPSPPEPVADDAALVDELYARPPAEFVARRDELAVQARAGGDRALATRIRALRRPSVGAWYLNTAVRAGMDSLGRLLRLGDQLREAQAAGDIARLRDLAARRGPLTGEVARDLGALMRMLGATATPAGLDEVRATLAGALADPAIAAEVESGRLDGPRTYSGFGDLSFAGPSPTTAAGWVGAATGGGPATGTPDAGADEAEHADEAERAAEAERARRRDAARRDLEAAEAAVSALAARTSEREADVTEARARVAGLAAQLSAAQHELAVAEAELADAANEERAAADRVVEARRRLSS